MVSLGIDEVGRGCWAGPLVVGAAILNTKVEGLKDSKLLSKNQREKLYAELVNGGCEYALGWVWPEEIDKLGLTKATTLGVERAISKIPQKYDEIIIDGNINYLPDNPLARPMIKADNLIPSVSAASIIAKVSRDKYMQEASKKYTNYGFDKHVGYGTKAHQLSLIKYGTCELHRLSFKPIKLMSANA